MELTVPDGRVIILLLALSTRGTMKAYTKVFRRLIIAIIKPAKTIVGKARSTKFIPYIHR